LPSSTLLARPSRTDVLARFRRDLPYYSRVCLRIAVKDEAERGLVPLKFWRAQQIVHAKISDQRRRTGRVRVIVLKARQEGVSTYTAGRFMRAMHLWSNVRAMVIADEDERSGVLYDIYDQYEENLPEDIRPGRKVSRRRQHLRLLNGSRLTVETAGDVQAGRAMTIHRLHISELGAWKKAEDTFISVIQAVPAEGSEVIVESTAQGAGNLFHRMWKLAEAGDSDWLPIFLPWWIHQEYVRELSPEERQTVVETADPWERKAMEEGIPWDPPGPGIPEVLESGAVWDPEVRAWRLTAEQLAWRRRHVRDNFEGDERAFRQEFPSTAREAFLVSGGAFFDQFALVEYEEKARKPDYRGAFIRPGGGLALQRDERGWVRVFEDPDAEGHYVIGVDTSEGKLVAARSASFSDPEGERGGRDFSSADVIKVSEVVESGGKRVRVPCLRQVAQIHGRMAPEALAAQVWGAGWWWSCPGPEGRRQAALIGVERNHSSGQTVIRWLRDHNYPNQYLRRRINQRTGKATLDIGWLTDSQTRRPMLDGMAEAIRNGKVEMPSAETIGECFTFVFADDGEPEGQEGTHDDRVISMAIALEMSRSHTDEPTAPPPEWKREDTPTGL
jgi:hypothetical protein